MANVEVENWWEDTDSSSSETDSDEEVSVDDIIAREKAGRDISSPLTFLRKGGKNLQWDYFLLKEENLKHIAPIKLFSHAPLADLADSFFALNIPFELPNPYVKCNRTVNWIASVVRFAGYRALVKYETFDCKPRFSWVDFCSGVPKPIGYSVTNKILLFPPYDVRKRYPDFLEEMKRRYPVGCPTLPASHLKTVQNSILATQKYKINDVVEIVDTNFIGESQNWLARVSGIIGDRIQCTFIGPKENDGGVWMNCRSEHVHDLGFSHGIGYTLAGVPMDLAHLYQPIIKEFSFPIEEQMLLEARHPVHTFRISSCKVFKVHKYGYFSILFESAEVESFQYLVHVSSPYIFPCGYSKSHGIALLPPSREDPITFDWTKYCKKKSLKRLRLDKLPQKTGNPFKVGMKMEAIDLRNPTYLGPATVTKVVEHLLLLHFDGWTRDNENYYQWTHYQSPDIYPLGWSTLVGHDFESYPENHRAEDEVNTENLNLPNILF